MKKTLSLFVCALTLGRLTAAEQNPKIAVAGVQAAPLLAKQYHGVISAANLTPSGDTGLEGSWEGVYGSRTRNGNHVVITISKSPDGVINGHWHSSTTGADIDSSPGVFSDNHLKLYFPTKKPSSATVEGSVDLKTGIWTAEVKAAETLPMVLKRAGGPLASSSLQQSASAQSASGVEGVWDGTFHDPKINRPNHATLTISKDSDGSLRAHWHSITRNTQNESTSVKYDGRHMEWSFPNSIAPTIEGEMDVATGTFSSVFHRPDGNFPLVLKRVGGPANIAAVSSPHSLSSGLEQLLHALDVQLADRIDKTHLFSVVGNSELKRTIAAASASPGSTYDLKDAGTARQFKRAGINYLLLTTLKDFQDQAIDVALKTTATQSGTYERQTTTGRRGLGGIGVGSSETFNRSQTQSAPQVTRGQIVRLTVEFQLFEIASGNRLDSAVHSFVTNRPYSALAYGSNQLAQTDLFEAAARNVAERAAILVGENVFPITVLDRGEKEITINRGAQAGLKVGQLYGVYTPGKELKDPQTGRVLGRDENYVGRVAIGDIRPEFSKATILEDRGISTGGHLRWMMPR